MKVVKQINTISVELKKQIPKLKVGEIKTFLMLNGVANPDPDPREVAKEPMIYGKRQISTNFRIFDKHKGDGGEFVDVGWVERLTPQGDVERYGMLVPGMNGGSRFQGKFSITGGKDDELWEILFLSPEREDSPCADGTAPLFRLLDFKAEAKRSNSRFDILKKSIEYAEKITAEKAREILAALNQPSLSDDDDAIAKIKELSRTKPEDFIATYESEDTPTKALIRAAMDASVLDYDMVTGKINVGGVVIATLKLEATESFVPHFAQWVKTADNGKNVLNNIKNQLAKKKEATKS